MIRGYVGGEEEFMKTNWHSIRTWIYLGCVGLTAVLGAIGSINPAWAETVGMICSFLGIIEHQINGNSGTSNM